MSALDGPPGSAAALGRNALGAAAAPFPGEALPSTAVGGSDVASVSASSAPDNKTASLRESTIDKQDGGEEKLNEPVSRDVDESADTFPFKLYRMLEEAETDGRQAIVSFNEKGRCFIIHKPKEFVDEIMPKYFTTSRMSSFQVRADKL
jgi:hypothetical protein